MEFDQDGRDQARGVAIRAHHDDLPVVVSDLGQPVGAGRIEKPLEHVPLDHHRPGQGHSAAGVGHVVDGVRTEADDHPGAEAPTAQATVGPHPSTGSSAYYLV